ncbi:MAG TPA: beta/gamma crystallin-related protein [Candidatus Polarisedimenticolaceae bacterium]|nr:beta/gamma crystallin-related protein [Candidatus Polarisedimenticolaceae bacterium]
MKAAVGALLLTATFAAPAAADIRVWADRDRQGDGREIRRAVRDLRNYDFDDRISSLETDEAWEVCSEPLYRGDCRIVKGVVPNLRVIGLNNRITSMRKASEEMLSELETIERPRSNRTEAAPVPSRKTTTPKPAPERSASPEEAKAEPVPSTATTKPKPTPEPPATAETTADPTPADAWRAVKPPPLPPAEPAAPTREWWQGRDETAGGPPSLDLFEKPNFEGKRVRLDQAVSDVTQLQQSVGSLLVRAGSWRICSKPQFRGRCRTVDASGMGVAETPLIGSLRPETD